MKRFFLGAFAAATLLAQSPAARANLFSLDGRFECLESAATVCGDAQAVAKPRPAPPPAVAQPAVVDSDEPILLAREPALAATNASAPPSTQARAPRIDPLQVVAARIQTRRPSSNDIAWLTQAAHNGDARAIELLAWCKLNAIGMARDPVQAYLLYGAAGDAALPHARENQRLIYERDLDSDQRQQVLNLANEGMTLARIMPSAR